MRRDHDEHAVAVPPQPEVVQAEGRAHGGAQQVRVKVVELEPSVLALEGDAEDERHEKT